LKPRWKQLLNKINTNVLLVKLAPRCDKVYGDIADDKKLYDLQRKTPLIYWITI
jgi:hypothetical protein